MIFLIIAAVAIICLFGYCFFVNNISFSPKHAGICTKALIIAGIIGAFLCLLSLTVFYVSVSGIEGNKTAAEVICDSYLMFAGTDLVFIAVCLIVTLAASLMKSPLRPIIPLVLPMWAIISLFWTWLYSVWSVFVLLNTAPFVFMYGIGCALLLSVSALPQSFERKRILEGDISREELIRRTERKKAERLERAKKRKRLSEKKRRLSHPEKKKNK